MYEKIKNVLSSGNLGATPFFDVTGTSEYEVIEMLLADGTKGAVPIWIVGDSTNGNLPATGNKPFKDSITYDEVGHLVWKDSTITSPTVIYVDVNNDDPNNLEDGSINYPYTSAQTGVNACPTGGIVCITAGAYNESLSIENKNNITVCCLSNEPKGQYRAVFSGSLTISGTSQRIGIVGLQFNGDYNYTSRGSLIYIDDLAIRGNTTLSTGGYHRYDNCFFFGVTVSGTTFADFRDCQSEDTVSWTCNVGASGVFSLRDCINAKYNHQSGFMSIVGGNVLPVGDNVGILSTASTGLLYMYGIDFYQIASSQYATINKTGTCDATIGICNQDYTGSTLNGTIKYLQTTVNHIKGLQAQIDSKSNVGDSYTKVEENDLLSSKVDKLSIVGLIQQQNTTNTPITTTESAVSGINITVPKTGLYTATVRLNVKKPSGGSATILTIRGKINGNISANTVRQRSVVNDGSVHYLEYTFTGNLTINDVLTLSVQASSSGVSLENGTGYVGCQVELLKIIEI